MRNDDDEVPLELDDDERRLFAELPRVATLSPGGADRMVQRLRNEGVLRRRRNGLRWGLAAAAAVLVFVAGAAAGERVAQRNSLEDMLARTDLSVADRVLLLQRAGSAYVRAAQSYADATAHIDSGAVEVASRVLLGAAHAVARNSLDAGLSAKLATVLQSSAAPGTPSAANRQPVIWY